MRTTLLLAALLSSGCKDNDADALLSCPPAPVSIQELAGRECAFKLFLPEMEFCNDATCQCVDGRLVCTMTALGCTDPTEPTCPRDAQPDAPCVSEGHNMECRMSGEPRLSCACDAPGPTWRCR